MDIGKVGKSTGALRCPHCLREKDKAIKMQVKRGCSCGDEKCAFIKEIQDAIIQAQASVFCTNCGTRFIDSTDNYCYICGFKK